MKIAIIVSALAAMTASAANGACPTTAATKQDISSLLSGRYACATRGSDKWNERHTGTNFSGNVEDYKQGPTDPVDPTEVVGTYSINSGTAGGPDSITYNYGSGGSYTYVVTPAGQTSPGTYSFCNIADSQVLTVTVSATHC